MTPPRFSLASLRDLRGRAPQVARGALRRLDAGLARWEATSEHTPARADTTDLLGRLGPHPVPIRSTPTSEPASVTVLGSFSSGGVFGGIATLLALAAETAGRTDRSLRIVETMNDGSPIDTTTLFDDLGVSVPSAGVELVSVAPRRRGEDAPLAVHGDDIVIASAWWDAALAASLPLERPFVYLVQDYEPIFYANGDEQVAARATYASPSALPVFNTSVLHEYFLAGEHRAFAERGASFEPTVLRPSAGAGAPAPRTIFFYGRPTVRRNLFATSLEGLDRASRDPALRGWDVVTAGAAGLPDVRLAGGQVMRSLGKLALPEYRDLIGSASVALSPMLAPHPNYPTLEFLQAGARVISTSWGTKSDLGRYGDGADLVPAAAGEIAGALVRACRAHDAGGTAPTVHPLPRTWREAFASTIDRIGAPTGSER